MVTYREWRGTLNRRFRVSLTSSRSSRKGIIFLGTSLALYSGYGLLRYREEVKRKSVLEVSTWQLAFYRTLPARILSRITGAICSVHIPVVFRSFIYRTFDYIYPCTLGDFEPLETYQTFQQFFTRSHNTIARQDRQKLIENSKKMADIVSPADGNIFAIGELNVDQFFSNIRLNDPSSAIKDISTDFEITNQSDRVKIKQKSFNDNQSLITESIEEEKLKLERENEIFVEPKNKLKETHMIQVKGVKIPLPELLNLSPEELKKRLHSVLKESKNSGRALYYCSVYLNPGSYHRFHSPVDDLQVEEKLHITGDLLPVATWFMRKIPCVPAINERVALVGNWPNGFFSYIPVGATNVGSIVIKDLNFSKTQGKIKMGDELGHFEMGSLVVMIFEGPKDARWHVAPNDPIRYGDPVISFR